MSDDRMSAFLPYSMSPQDIGTEANKRARLASGANAKPTDQLPPGETTYDDAMGVDNMDLDEMLYARYAEVDSLNDLVDQRGTNIPALYKLVGFIKPIQNPSTVSVETFKRMWDTDETVGSGLILYHAWLHA